MTTTALIAGRPSAVVRREPATHFIPSRSSAPSGSAPAQVRRHRVRERALRPRVDPDLRRQLGVGDERGHRLLGQRQALVDVGHRGKDVRGREIAERGRSGAKDRDTLASLRGDDGLRCRRAPHRRRAEPRQPEAGTRRDRPVRRALHDREGSAAGGRLRADRRQRAPPRRHLGAKLRELGADVPAPRRPADARPLHHPGRPAARDRRGRRPRQGARRRRGGRIRRPGARPRSRRSPPTSASTR